MSGPSQAHFSFVGGWLNDLAVFVAGKAPLEDVKVKIAAMTGLLASKAPSEWFTPESLEFCACQADRLASSRTDGIRAR
jgi:hypothetical protein